MPTPELEVDATLSTVLADAFGRVVFHEPWVWSRQGLQLASGEFGITVQKVFLVIGTDDVQEVRRAPLGDMTITFIKTTIIAATKPKPKPKPLESMP